MAICAVFLTVAAILVGGVGGGVDAGAGAEDVQLQVNVFQHMWSNSEQEVGTFWQIPTGLMSTN